MLARCREVTAEAERRAARRFVEPEDREQALLTRGLLRLALSHGTGLPPRDWRFVASPRGRPSIAPPVAGAAIDFNISHTRGCIVCAVSTLARVGVDVEGIGRAEEIRSVSNRFLSTREIRLVASMPPRGDASALVRLWTAKEALAKGIGAGLGLALDKVCFAGALDSDPDCVEPLTAGRWGVRSFMTSSGKYLLSIAIRNFDPAHEIILRDSHDLFAC